MFRYSLNQIDPLLSLNLAFHNLYEAENHVPLFNPLSEKVSNMCFPLSLAN